jgi:hypothetical protein
MTYHRDVTIVFEAKRKKAKQGGEKSRSMEGGRQQKTKK